MRKTLSLGLVFGIIALAVLGAALVLDFISTQEARDITVKVMSVIGIAVLAMLAISFVTKPSQQ